MSCPNMFNSSICRMVTKSKEKVIFWYVMETSKSVAGLNKFILLFLTFFTFVYGISLCKYVSDQELFS